MKTSFKQRKRVGVIWLAIALAFVLLLILPTGWNATESEASSERSSSVLKMKAAGGSQGPVPIEQCVPPPLNLVSWWPGENNAADIQGDNDGTISGTVTFTPGKVGKAFNFAGAGCVSIPDNASLRPANLTIDAWVRPASAPAGVQPIFTKDGAGFVGYELRIDYGALFPNGTIVFLLNVNNMVQVVPSTNPIPNDGQFHLIAATYDGTTAILYLDGFLNGSAVLPGTLTHATDPALIGCGIFRSPAVAEIDEVEVFRRALTQAEILSIFVAGSKGKCRPPCDTQPPSISCPPDITAVTDQNACPSPACQTVTFPTPVPMDDCPGTTVACSPASGSCFPAGTTTVTCTATDVTGLSASCSFTVTVFDVALQDDSNPNIVLLWNSATGAYRFCCAGTTYTDIGSATRQGCVYTLQHDPADRRVLGRVDKAVHAGSASIQYPPGVTRCTITDRNTLDDNNATSCH